MLSYKFKEHHLACNLSKINTMELYLYDTNVLLPGTEQLLRS